MTRIGDRSDIAELGFNPAALRAKYREERDRRLHAEGTSQYVAVDGAFSHFLEDPYVDPGFTRAPLSDEVEAVVVGGRFGGLMAAARLREAGIDDVRIIERGVVVGGVEYELNCLIYSTGFEFQTDYAGRVGFQTYGRCGLTLTEKWAGGISTLHGFTTHGFPNLFVLGNAQTANTPNFTHMLNIASRHVAHIVRHCADQKLASIEPSEEAAQDWVADVLSFAGIRRAFDEECTPGYYNNEGMPSDQTERASFYGGGPILFTQKIDAWRAAGDLPGMICVRQ